MVYKFIVFCRAKRKSEVNFVVTGIAQTKIGVKSIWIGIFLRNLRIEIDIRFNIFSRRISLEFRSGIIIIVLIASGRCNQCDKQQKIMNYYFQSLNKVKSVMESFLSDVTFYSSVHYKIVEDEVEKNPELDILGVSDKAVYIIEVKAHELSYKDRVRLDGAKYKFKASVAEACKQCCRSVDFINNSTEPIFGTQQGAVLINKTKPIYKIAVTFQHYSSLLGQMDKLVAASLMEERFRDTWVVSLFDLMVVADFVESEDEFLSYLDMRKIINTNHSTFHDELDLLGQFLNENLADKVIANKPMMIIGGSSDIDEEYAKDFYLPINLSSEKE